jgi:hypothetical protein
MPDKRPFGRSWAEDWKRSLGEVVSLSAAAAGLATFQVTS